MATTARAGTKNVILALTCAAQFMVVLDVAIVNVALPSIQRDLGVSQSTAGSSCSAGGWPTGSGGDGSSSPG